MTRYRLTTQPPIEFDDMKAAQVALVFCARQHHKVRLLDTLDRRRAWMSVDGVVFPRGALLTYITKQREDATEDDPPYVEVLTYDNIHAKKMNVAITVPKLMKMLADGFVEMDSSSGEDPNLHYHYDHYLVV